MQISGHKNVAFINNYSTLSEERHKKISNILLASCFGLMTDSAVVDAALRKSGLISNGKE